MLRKMGDRSKISWLMGDDGIPGATWNPIVGCSKVSEGCGTGKGSCYAIGVCHRGLADHHRGLTVVTDDGIDWNGDIHRAPDSIFYKPLEWARPRRIFPTSLSDPFHENLTRDQIAEMWAVMALAHWHTFELLTKRSKRMREVLNDPDFPAAVRTHATYVFDEMKGAVAGRGRRILEGNPWLSLSRRGGDRWEEMPWPLPNVWCGVSIELDKYRFRADHLRDTPAAVRWISAEPLLGPLPNLDLTSIDWLVVGGMSGHDAVRMDPEWVLDLLDRAVESGEKFCGDCGDLIVRELSAPSYVHCRSVAGHDYDHRAADDGTGTDRTAFHMKQTGVVLAREWGLSDTNGSDPDEWPAKYRIREYPRG